MGIEMGSKDGESNYFSLDGRSKGTGMVSYAVVAERRGACFLRALCLSH